MTEHNEHVTRLLAEIPTRTPEQWDAAWSAARSAARSAAWSAAWSAAGDAAWDAARSAAGDAAVALVVFDLVGTGDWTAEKYETLVAPARAAGFTIPTPTERGTPVTNNDEKLYTPAEVGRLFRVDPKTVTRWATAGKLHPIRTLGGHRRYRAAEVDALREGQAR